MSFAEANAISREPSKAKNARQFNPDLMPWEKQPTETDDQYRAFRTYRDSENRRVGEVGPTAENWSSMWSWGWRAYQWDLYVAAQADQEMVRYRLQMNERHRAVAGVAVSKVVQWLQSMDPTKMRPAEAARWFEVAVRVQREASGMLLAESAIPGIPDPESDDSTPAGTSLAEVLGLDGLSEEEAAVALYRSVKGG